MALKSASSKEFFEILDRRARERRNPLRAMFELTYRCNFGCIYCYLTDKERSVEIEKEINIEEVKRILEELKEAGVSYIGFTGGEIFLREDIFQILSYAKKCGFLLSLFTNGSLIDEEVIKKLKEIKPFSVEVNFHAMDEMIFDKITQTKGSYQKARKAVDLLLNNNIHLILKTSGIKLNKEEVVKVNRFARNLGILHTFSGEITPRRDGSTEPVKHSLSVQEIHSLRYACHPEMFPSHDEYGRFRIKPEMSIKRSHHKLFNCEVGQNAFSIDPYGRMNLCLQINYPQYQILKGSIKDGWQRIKDFVDSLRPPEDFKCRDCGFLEYCSWCPGRSFLENRDFITCSPYFREMAEYQKRAVSLSAASIVMDCCP